VLAVVEEGPARAAVVEAARQSRWVLDVADSLGGAMEAQRVRRHAVVVYQRELPGDDWRWAVSRCARMAGQPCVILLSRLTDHNLWVELARHGGSDLLREPVEVPALGAAVQNAWSLWQTQQKLRRRADHRRQQRPA
jgi:DNA-binding response OmpR family regulator